ncbi:MAG: TonB family protein, partial [Muribaculaceae bacterium]|nr:TonB family protein [Muribaculaceae bacterium]
AVHFGGDGTPTSKTPSLGVSPGFSPIEQYTQVKNFDPRLDVYAFSATCLYLLTGKAPVEALNMPAGYVRSVMPQHVIENVASAIERGMSKEKDQRTASIAELLESFVPSAVPPTVPPMPAGQNMAPTRALPPVAPVPAAPLPVAPPVMPPVQQEVYSGGNAYSYDQPEHEGGSKKKLVLAIVCGVLGLALLAGIAFWVIKGSSKGNDQASDELGASVESVSDEASGYFDEEVSDGMIAGNDNNVEAKKIPADKPVIEPPKTIDELEEDNRVIGAVDEDKGTDDIRPLSKVEEKKPEPKKDDEVYKSVTYMPSFPGGDAALMSFIIKNIKYPKTAQDNGIQGKVVVQFVVEKNGKVGEVRVIRGVDNDLDREAVRICKMLPAFSPGRNAAGDPVRVWYTLPISFKLQGTN